MQCNDLACSIIVFIGTHYSDTEPFTVLVPIYELHRLYLIWAFPIFPIMASGLKSLLKGLCNHASPAANM